MTPPTGPSKKQKSNYGKMAKLKGDAFDKSFARDMVADHKKDIAAYKKEAKQDDPAGHYAKDSLPTLRKHLDTAESLVKER
jgi:putative membrane protein